MYYEQKQLQPNTKNTLFFAEKIPLKKKSEKCSYGKTSTKNIINDIIAERKSELQYYNDITENITKRMGAISNEAAKAALIAINADRQNGKTPLYVCCCAQCHNLVNVENTIESERVFQNLFDSENSHTKMLPLQICTKCAEKEYIKELEEDAAFDKMCDEMNI